MMRRLIDDERTEAQFLCAQIRDHVEILTNLIFLIQDGRSTGVEKRKYLRIAGDKLMSLCLIVRKCC